MKKLLTFFVLLVFLSGAHALAQSSDPGVKPLSITVTKSLYLPPDMYGHWSVTATLEQTNADESLGLNTIAHDIWVLEQQGDKIVLTNPVNGASAEIQVDQVNDHTATFHRMIVLKDRMMLEMPTITVDGDHLTGVSINKFQRVRDGRVVSSYYAQYRIEAQRIGEARVHFGDDNGGEAKAPDIDIEDVHPETPSHPYGAPLPGTP